MSTGPEFFTISKYILFLVQDNRNSFSCELLEEGRRRDHSLTLLLLEAGRLPQGGKQINHRNGTAIVFPSLSNTKRLHKLYYRWLFLCATHTSVFIFFCYVLQSVLHLLLGWRSSSKYNKDFHFLKRKFNM
jgi:hypothetical protein